MYLKNTWHGGTPLIRDLPLIDPGSSANIEVGAALLAGTTTNRNGFIRGASALADFVGMCNEQALSAAFGTVAAGTLVRRQCVVEPAGIYMVQWSTAAADLVANDVSSATTSAVTFTTSQTDDFDGGYLYCVTGTGAGQLRYIGAATTTVLTVGTNMEFTTALSTDSDVLLIQSPNTQLQDMETTARSFAGQNGSGGAEVGRVCILANWIQDDSTSLQEMIPATHGELDGLNNTNVRFWAETVFTNTFLHKID